MNKIKSICGVAKGVEEIEMKAKAELVEPDPVDAEEIIERNINAKKDEQKDIRDNRTDSQGTL